jgi:RNA polymerase sigma-70 factor (ECF subfamily)
MSPLAFDGTQDNIDIVTINLQSDLPDPEESMINHQKIAALKDIIGQLKPRYRELIQLRYYKEYSYEEISAEMKIPIGTVKAELYRAKTLLYNILIKTENR